MFFIVAADKYSAFTTSVNWLFITTMSADSIATSVPVPMAVPILARANAGASLMPSPTIMTIRPSSCSLLTIFSLSAGRTSLSTLSMPSFLATAWAVTVLSPVTIHTCWPLSFMAFTATMLSGFIGSAIPKIAEGTSFIKTTKGVFPSEASFSINFLTA